MRKQRGRPVASDAAVPLAFAVSHNYGITLISDTAYHRRTHSLQPPEGARPPRRGGKLRPDSALFVKRLGVSRKGLNHASTIRPGVSAARCAGWGVGRRSGNRNPVGRGGLSVRTRQTLHGVTLIKKNSRLLGKGVSVTNCKEIKTIKPFCFLYTSLQRLPLSQEAGIFCNRFTPYAQPRPHR